MMQITGRKPAAGAIRAAIFDFDGTISTLRHGWEQVMRPMMLEMLDADETDGALRKMVDDYIDKSTGIQTIYQMMWLTVQMASAGLSMKGRDAWWYKDEYNRRLMQTVSQRTARIKQGAAHPDDYMIKGAAAFLKSLKKRQIKLYLASGTDHEDVCSEAALLGVYSFFDGIKGAPKRQASCPKEAVIQSLIEADDIQASQLLIVGDGKVEIVLGAEMGAFTIGIASDEEKRCGIHVLKRDKLIHAGADLIAGDFEDVTGILNALNLP